MKGAAVNKTLPIGLLTPMMAVDVTAEPAVAGDALSALAARARSGDREAFGELVEVVWTDLVGLARAILAERSLEAEDVVQDALITAWCRLRGLRRPGAVQAWLARIVSRRCFAVARRVHRVEPREPVAAPEGPASDLRLDFERLLRRLSPGQRAVLYLGSVEGLDDLEISRRLGLLPPTVRVHRLRARRRLRQLLGG